MEQPQHLEGFDIGRVMLTHNLGEAALTRLSDTEPNGQRHLLRRRIYDELRRMIVSGDVSPGQAISIESIGKIYGVSRTPVREAFLRLAEEGLAIIVPQVGVKVAPIDLRQVYEAQFVREVLERACLSVGAHSISKATLASFDRTLREQAIAIKEREHTSFFHWDQAFHGIICSMSGFHGISRITNSARAHLDRMRRLSLKENLQLMKELFDEHRAIVKALKRNDLPTADYVLKEHLRRIFLYADELFKLHPEFFVGPTTESRSSTYHDPVEGIIRENSSDGPNQITPVGQR